MATVDRASVPGTASARWDRLVFAIVLVGVVAAAALLYVRFLGRDRLLWVNSSHDRNAHYLMALSLAEAVRHGHVLKVLMEVNGARVWGPLHASLAALVLLVGGFDYRLAVLPSLAGWTATALFAFLAARRAAPRWGNLAGLVALLFVLAGPAHRGYATDVMLESLGAGLTLAALYAYLVAVQERTAAAGRWLGLVLTLLYLEKYNYWMIVVLALAAATLPGVLADRGASLLCWLRGPGPRALLGRELLRPSSWLVVGLVVISALVWRHGDRPWDLAGSTVNLYPPYNILQIAYILVFLRLLLWWRAGGRELTDGLELPWQPLVRWHAWPVLLWMLLPKHLGYFLWFLSPANNPQAPNPHAPTGFLAGVRYYAPEVVSVYHTSAASLALALGLFLVALVAAGRLRPGAGAVLGCFLLGALLTARHPNHQTRFLHSWMAAGWVGAGLGLAVLLPSWGRVKELFVAASGPAWRNALAGASGLGLGLLALGGVAWATIPVALADRPVALGGPQPERASVLDLTDFYAADLVSAHKAVVLTEVPFRFPARWTALQLRPDPSWFDCVECYRGGFAPPGVERRDGLLAWLARCDCDTLVSIEDGPEACYWEWIERGLPYEHLGVLLIEQGAYHPVKRRLFPRQGCVVTVWKRSAG